MQKELSQLAEARREIADAAARRGLQGVEAEAMVTQMLARAAFRIGTGMDGWRAALISSHVPLVAFFRRHKSEWWLCGGGRLSRPIASDRAAENGIHCQLRSAPEREPIGRHPEITAIMPREACDVHIPPRAKCFPPPSRRPAHSRGRLLQRLAPAA